MCGKAWPGSHLVARVRAGHLNFCSASSACCSLISPTADLLPVAARGGADTYLPICIAGKRRYPYAGEAERNKRNHPQDTSDANNSFDSDRKDHAGKRRLTQSRRARQAFPRQSSVVFDSGIVARPIRYFSSFFFLCYSLLLDGRSGARMQSVCACNMCM